MCNCIEGWTGVMCEASIDDCAGHNCAVQNSKCIDEHLGYRCQCEDGFVGM